MFVAVFYFLYHTLSSFHWLCIQSESANDFSAFRFECTTRLGPLEWCFFKPSLYLIDLFKIIRFLKNTTLKVTVADKLFKNITVEIVLGAILRQYNCEWRRGGEFSHSKKNLSKLHCLFLESKSHPELWSDTLIITF